MCLLYMVGFVCIFEDGLYYDCHIAHSYITSFFHHSDDYSAFCEEFIIQVLFNL